MPRQPLALLAALALLTGCPSEPEPEPQLPPSVVSVAITPDPATAADALTCAAETAFDGEGAVTVEFAWTVDGQPGPTGAALSAGTATRGQEVVCTATPSAGELVGDPGTASLTIANAAPAASDLVITPDPAKTLDELTCTATGADPDGDTVTLAFSWTVDGADAGTGPTLGATSFVKGQTVACTATPNDGTLDGEPATGSVTIANTPPGAPGIALDPDPPFAGANDLICRIDTAADDDDDDALTYTFAWTRDGAAYTDATTTALPGDTVPGSAISGGQVWTCEVVASDGEADGPAASATTTAIDWAGPITLTTCGQTGATGPSQGQCDAAYATTGVEVVVRDGIQRWEVPITATYRIEVAGARGGDQTNYGSGGSGARMIGDFDLEAGDVLKILVGQSGKNGTFYDNSGGGGTFVALDDDTPLIVAGGGGAPGNCGSRDATVVDGTRAEGDGSGGTAGNNGSWCGCGGDGSGGGGFFGNGQGDGGKSFVNGGAGATSTRPDQCITVGPGGFGGGGNGGNGGPGGGGYEGGAGGGEAVGPTGQGGKSYNDGRNQENTSGANNGPGYVTIDVVR